MKKVLFVILFLSFAETARTQTTQSWTLRRYVCASSPCTNVGNTVETSMTLLPANVTCNVSISGTVTPVNPLAVQFDDPDNLGKFCQWRDSGTGILLTAAQSNTKQYGVTISRTVVGNATPSAETNLVSFTVPLVIPIPSVPTGLKVIQ